MRPWISIAAVLWVAVPASAQDWSWPEKAENLKVLPAETSADDLRAAMRGFTRALGVRCNHCHVGKEGEPLSTYDFASDENPKKETARLMMRMTGSVQEQVSQIDTGDKAPASVNCTTCHRGRPRPITLDRELSEVYSVAGLDSTVSYYQKLRGRFHGRGSYDFGEEALNNFGYDLLEKGAGPDAVRIMQMNLELFPESGNVHDSLAEAYLAVGNKELAIQHYEKAVELDPRNGHAKQKLEELKTK